jgi:hypothetical protein
LYFETGRVCLLKQSSGAGRLRGKGRSHPATPPAQPGTPGSNIKAIEITAHKARMVLQQE